MWIWLSWSIRRNNNNSDIYVFMVDSIYMWVMMIQWVHRSDSWVLYRLDNAYRCCNK